MTSPTEHPAGQDQAAEHDPAPVTGVRTIFDVVRHLIHYGAGATQEVRDELLAAVDHADPDHHDGQDQADTGPSTPQAPAEAPTQTGGIPA